MPILSPIRGPSGPLDRRDYFAKGCRQRDEGGGGERRGIRKRRTRKEGWQSPRESSHEDRWRRETRELRSHRVLTRETSSCHQEIYTRCWGRWQASERADQHTLEKRTRMYPALVRACARVSTCTYPDLRARLDSPLVYCCTDMRIRVHALYVDRKSRWTLACSA